MKKKLLLSLVTISLLSLAVFFGQRFLSDKASLSSQPQVLAQTSSSNWPQVQSDAGHTGYVPQTVGAPFDQLWQWKEAPISTRVQPVVAFGKVFLPANDGRVYTIDINSGITAWTSEKLGPFVNSAAVGLDSGLVFAGSTDKNVYALNVNNGQVQWRYPTEGRIRSAPTVTSNTVFIGSTDGYFYALDEQTGSERWKTDIGQPIFDTAAYDNGKVFFGAMDLKVYALDANDGHLEWSKQVYGQAIKDRWTVAGNGKVVVSTMPYDYDYGLLQEGSDLLDEVYQQSWSQQKQRILDYFAHPENYGFSYPANHNRTFYVLNAETGEEESVAPVLYASGGSGSAHSLPVLLPNGSANVIYRWSGGYPVRWGKMTHDGIFLGEMNLESLEIECLDHCPIDSDCKAPFISDESSRLMRSGDYLYLTTSRGAVGFNTTNSDVFPFVTTYPPTGGFFWPCCEGSDCPIPNCDRADCACINFNPEGDWDIPPDSGWRPTCEGDSDGNNYGISPALAGEIFYFIEESKVIAVRGTYH